MDKDYIRSLFVRYVTPHSYKPTYGTAGFRSDAEHLEAVIFRCGMLMSLRALHTGKNCGIMITASHNPEKDNGVKLVDFTGEMINDEWQSHATRFAQADTFEQFWTWFEQIGQLTLPLKTTPTVFVGMDTRSSGEHLANICCFGIMVSGVKATFVGQVTTPELHYNVQQSNKLSTFPSYSEYLLKCYSDMVQHMQYMPPMHQTLHVDCANGVGFLRLSHMKPYLQTMGIDIILYNTGGGDGGDKEKHILNHECGADYVEKQKTFPRGMSDVDEGARCCSLDGDADRIVYFTKKHGQFVLLNGDKIACLLAKYLHNLSCNMHATTPQTLSIGVVQTAYSNGASTSYISHNFPNMQIECTHTGVQYLHQAAHKYDIGIYFEANGHGTVLFSNKAKEDNRLCIISKVLSQVVGDAIGNMLIIEHILACCKYTLDDWLGLYEDYHTVQDKLYVNRDAFETKDYGRVLVRPWGLQYTIDTILKQYMYAKPRAFVRPSGTENCVRLYVEGTNEKCVSTIHSKIKDAILAYPL